MARVAYAIVLLLVAASAAPLAFAAKADLATAQTDVVDVEVRRELVDIPVVNSELVDLVEDITTSLLSLKIVVSNVTCTSVLQLLTGTGHLATLIRTLIYIVNDVIKLLAKLLGSICFKFSGAEAKAILTALQNLVKALQGLVSPVVKLVNSLLKSLPKGLLGALGQLLSQLLMLVKYILDTLLTALITAIPAEKVAINNLLKALDISLQQIINAVLEL